ncbi:hypothetical protein SLS62_000889 [Diatrype stigma]|uniref:FAD-binding domain-containing protein n=1 Tax=Diatrype stigma TaxID=117547 RepID=A0AAN9YS30_9PEZI
MAAHSCRIVIVGGSVAGLTLANMLEQVGIDFVILEAGKDIAPQDAGDALQDLVEHSVNHTYYRNEHGDTIFEFRGLADGLAKRHGYPVIFIERQMLLRKLYENMKQKGKVLVKKRVVQIDQAEDGVRAITEDGSIYEGDILIGADGIHSTVRKQMHQLANISSPGYFDRDEYSSPGRIYWFLNVKNEQVTHGKGVPRYSVDDEFRLAKQHFEDRINEYDTFGDVYKSKIISRLTPLHEYQWKRWHFGRIMTIGDACHKLHPIGGNGGGAAVEDAAALVNALLRQLRQPKQRLSTADFHHVFSTAQRVQEGRTKQLILNGTMLQQFDAMESVLSPLIVRFVIPNLTDDAALSVIGVNASQGQRVEALPVPQRDRYVPYDDELPAKPLKTALAVNFAFALVHLLVLYLAFFPGKLSETWATTLGKVVPERYTDAVVNYFALNSGRSTEGPIQPQDSVIAFIPVILIWILEGHRRGNLGSLWSWYV